jgi:hypothetical protein
MYIPRLLLLALLISVCIVPVAAQSSPDKNAVSSRPLMDGLVTPPEFRMSDPALKFQGPVTDDRSTLIPNLQAPKLDFDSQTSTLVQDDGVCLSMRTYRVVRDDPKSDSTRAAGYSECQPAARFQVRTAVDSREIEPR